MTMAVNMHVGTDETINTSTRFHKNAKGGFTVTDIKVGNEQVSLFLHKIEDVDALAFVFETLARELRTVYGWTPKKENEA